MNSIIVTKFPNENCRDFHVKKRIAKENFQWWESQLEAETKPAPIYVRRIFEINGVESVSIGQYEIHVTKAAAFGWSEIEERIKAIIELEILEKL